jgi:hypothetical protein
MKEGLVLIIAFFIVWAIGQVIIDHMYIRSLKKTNELKDQIIENLRKQLKIRDL